MKRKIGIVDNDSSFVKRFASLMNAKYDDIEILIFPELHLAQTAANQIGLAVLFIDGTVAKRNHLNSNKKILIPEQCKVVILTTGEATQAGFDLPAVCKYMSLEEWREEINYFCMEEKARALGGCPSESSVVKTCLLISKGGGVGASAATILAEYFNENGKKTISLAPFLQSGEEIVRTNDDFGERFDMTFLCLSLFDKESIVLPLITANAIIFVTDGNSDSNDFISKNLEMFSALPEFSMESIYSKSFLLYNGFDKKQGEMFLNNKLVKLGGLDSAENIKASCEKLEMHLCMMK